ncbi:hypothetical protein ABZW18_04165 [Streptomyces sp. NPDC004647]|uniref:hypothetical protein n=1 Tax=Streptomyces sp. NPDC004647 TaxID=3154671 RepID=UPI0033A6A779
MPVASDAPPAFGRSDVKAVVVTTASLPKPNAAELADTVAARWQAGPWPAEQVALSVFTSGDGTSVLTYAQWSARGALEESLKDVGSVSWANAPGALLGEGADNGVRTTGPLPFGIYRTVRGTAVTEEDPVPVSFPVAFFTMADEASATAWVDGLLSAEEENEGDERAYPGAIAANFHVSLDGTRVLVLSEWLSEEAASQHIADVWDPILAHFGGDAGALYRHHTTLNAPEKAAG